MFLSIPNRRGGTKAPATVALSIIRAKGDGLRLDIYISKLFTEGVSALGLDNGINTVSIGIGIAGTPDEGLMRISRGPDFRVQAPYNGKPYYRVGFYLTKLIPKSLAEQLFSTFHRTWITRDKLRITENGELLIALPDVLGKVLPKAMLSIAKKGGLADGEEQG